MRALRAVGVVGVLALASCKLSVSGSNPADHVTGVVRVEAVPGAGGALTTSPKATFFSGFLPETSAVLPDRGSIADSCVLRALPVDTAVPFGFTHVDAGSSIGVKVASATGTLVPDTSKASGFVSYDLVGSPLPIAAGDLVTFAIPGAAGAFPKSGITANLLSAFTLGPVDPKPTGPLAITWSPAAGGGVFVHLDFEFATGTQTVANEEITCTVPDFGQFTIPPSLAAQWANAVPGTQAIDAFKWAITERETDAVTLLVVTQIHNPQITVP